ncbi:MAG: ABC-2 family transporter protein [Firmicutes bacterium]|nr:ABC-2 family transporter protein [Bacillota bacterium]
MFIFFAALAFWTIEGHEIANIFTDGGRELSQYPLTIYAKSIQRFFTFIVPFGVINTIPLNYLLDKQTLAGHFTALIPYLGILFLLPALLFWNYGVKRYQSTGS